WSPFGSSDGAGDERARDRGRPGGDCVPLAVVAVLYAEQPREEALAAGQLAEREPAAEHVVVARMNERVDVGGVDLCAGRLRPDRAAREEPRRSGREQF